MELFRPHTSIKNTIKFKLPCQERVTDINAWLSVSKLLSYSVENVGILTGLLNRKQPVVVKFGNASSLKREYEAGRILFENKLPNFIKFICFFTCNDEFDRIIHQNYQKRPYICNGRGDGFGCIVMPYYSIGSLNTFAWKKHHLPLFKNVLTQVCFALCHAYATTGFAHADLHANNVLLRNTKKQSVTYGSVCALPLMGYYALIMDLESSTKNDIEVFASSIRRIIFTACVADASDLVLDFDTLQVGRWINKHPILDTSAFIDIARMIQSTPLRYVKSERPNVQF